jgi:hypothetical protein
MIAEGPLRSACFSDCFPKLLLLSLFCFDIELWPGQSITKDHVTSWIPLSSVTQSSAVTQLLWEFRIIHVVSFYKRPPLNEHDLVTGMMMS